jgi:PAS domain S-box-containing protein
MARSLPATRSPGIAPGFAAHGAVQSPSQAAWQQMVQRSPVGLFQTDAAGRCVYINQRWCELTGLAANEAEGEGWKYALHPEDRERITVRWDHAARDATSFADEYRFLHPDGAVVWVYGQATPEVDDQGSVVAFIGSITEISERRQAEERLRTSEARLHALARATTSALWTVDAAGDVVDAPLTRWPYLTDLPEEELAAEWLAAVHPGDREPGNTIWRDAVSAGRPFAFEQRVRQRDGSLQHFAVRAVPVQEEDGTIREWVGADVNVTERKRAEEAQRESEERLRLGIEIAGFALAEIDYEANTIHLTAEAARLYGLGDEETTVPRQRVHATFHPDNRDELVRKIAQAPDPEARITYTTEYRVLWPNGEARWVSVRKRFLFDHSSASPRPLRAMLAVLDVTDRKRVEDERLTFLDVVAHDMKNPLTAAKGQIQLLRRRLQRDAVDLSQVQHGLEGIESAVNGAVSLLDELLDAAHIRAGRPLDLSLAPADLVALATSAVREVARNTTTHAVRVAADVPSLTGMWDGNRLGRVLANLLGNAVKYSPGGGEIVVRVWREHDPSGAWAMLDVRDEGMGIPAADLPYLFEHFRRGRNVASIKGTGIGLTGVRLIVEQHGGTVDVQSEEGQGSTFTVRLPLFAAVPDSVFQPDALRP